MSERQRVEASHCECAETNGCRNVTSSVRLPSYIVDREPVT